jgi:hypothetical protein
MTDTIIEPATEAAPPTPAPQAPEPYTITRPDMPDGVTWDDAFEKAAIPVAQKLGLSPTQLQGLADFYAQHQSDTGLGAMRQRALDEAAASDALKAEWGAHYDTKLAQASRAARYFGGEQLIAVLNETGLGNHPDLVRAFARAGAFLGEDALRASGQVTGVLPPDEALKKATALMARPAYASRAHPEHGALVDEVRQLFEQAYAGPGS